MPKTIISDTSCLIILTNIGELELLRKVYGQIITTPDIAGEFGEALPDWVEIIAVTDKYRQQILEMQSQPQFSHSALYKTPPLHPLLSIKIQA